MNSLPSSLYTAALALCLFSAGLLRGKKTRTDWPFAYFSAFLTIESLCFVFELLMAHPTVPLKALWLGLRMGTSLFIAPCLWLATREITEGRRPKWNSLGWRHLVPILIGSACTLPLIDTAHFGTDYYNPNKIVSPLHSRVIHGTMLLCVGVFACQVPIYLWRCRRILMERLALQGSRSQTRDVSSPAWLQFPLLVVFTTWILGLLRTFQCASHAPQEFIALFALIEVGVTVGSIYSIFRRISSLEIRPVFSPAPSCLPEAPFEIQNLARISPETGASPSVKNITVAAIGPTTEEQGTPAIASTPEPKASTPWRAKDSKYAKSSLPPEVRQRIKRKLQTAFASELLYRNSLLNLGSLSGSIKEDAHYVSQVINQELNSSFYQLVSRYRIDEAKKLLVIAPERTVLEIALLVGFNSKSTFNAAFLRNTGKTPSGYRISRG